MADEDVSMLRITMQAKRIAARAAGLGLTPDQIIGGFRAGIAFALSTANADEGMTAAEYLKKIEGN